jgi:hypothetical protein
MNSPPADPLCIRTVRLLTVYLHVVLGASPHFIFIFLLPSVDLAPVHTSFFYLFPVPLVSPSLHLTLLLIPPSLPTHTYSSRNILHRSSPVA